MSGSRLLLVFVDTLRRNSVVFQAARTGLQGRRQYCEHDQGLQRHSTARQNTIVVRSRHRQCADGSRVPDDRQTAHQGTPLPLQYRNDYDDRVANSNALVTEPQMGLSVALYQTKYRLMTDKGYVLQRA